MFGNTTNIRTKTLPEIYNCITGKYRKEGVSEAETFTKNSKYAIKQFFYDIEKINEDTMENIRAEVCRSLNPNEGS